MTDLFWERLVCRVRPQLLARLYSYGNSREDAEDATQDALIRLMNSLHTLGMEQAMPMQAVEIFITMQEKRLLAWLTSTSCYCLLDAHRRRCGLPLLSLQDIPEEALPVSHGMVRDVHAALQIEQAWQKLTNTDQELLLLWTQGHDCTTIALYYGLREETLKKRLKRSRDRFQQSLISVGLEDFFTSTRILSRNTRSASLQEGKALISAP